MYRLTLVNDYNVEQIQEYSNLIALGEPDFIEVKGVTFCGTGVNTSSGITTPGKTDAAPPALRMSNCPYHHEVVSFCQRLCSLVTPKSTYEIACEHEHSCCVLIAHRKFFIDGHWHTWINYEKFSSLVNDENLPPFSSLEYIERTPDWAVFGSSAKGFDPQEKRHFRKKNPKTTTVN